MTMNPRKALLPVLLLACLCRPVRAYDFTAVDKLLSDSLSALGDSVVVLIKQGDALVYHNRHGNLDSSSRIGIASATKWISGAVILRLAEKKLIGLDDTLGAYLPAFSANGKGHLTIRQCFSMTSGLHGGRNFEINPLMTLQRSVDSIAVSTPLAFPPGTRFAYAGAGMQAVGRIAEIVTGKPWSEVAREEILDPCGMDATGYDNFGPLNPAIAGGIQSSAREYMRFLTMVMSGGMYQGRRVLSAASIEEMFQDQTRGAEPFEIPWPAKSGSYPDGEPPGYGFGCWAMATNAATGREDEVASPGYYGAFPWADRCRDLYGMVLVHNAREGGRAHYVALQLVDLVRKAVGGCQASGLTGPAGTAPSRRGYRFRYVGGIPVISIGSDGAGGFRTLSGRLLPR
jgi:CubicO group peptidase (beta-lactamase class C family)